MVGSNFDLVVGGTESSGRPKGSVLRQEPGSQERATRGSTIEVGVSGGPAKPGAGSGKLDKRIEKLEQKKDRLEKKRERLRDRKS